MGLSLFGQYIREREGKLIVESEVGFATYMFWPDQKACYIEDIFVLPEFRRSHQASLFADQIAIEAKNAGMQWLVGSVKATLPSSTASVKVLLGYGMQVDSAENGVIWFKKEIV
jgi:hypothetical protein